MWRVAARRPPQPSRALRASPQAAGVFDGIRDAFGGAVSGSEQKREQQVFDAQFKMLADPHRRIDGDAYLELLTAMKAASGMSGVKEHLPWVQNNPALAEFKDQEKVVLAMTPAERRNVYVVHIAAKKRIVAATGVSLTAVESVIGQISSLASIQKWLVKRIKSGLPSPTTPQELQNMVSNPSSGMARRSAAGAAPRPGVANGGSKMKGRRF